MDRRDFLFNSATIAVGATAASGPAAAAESPNEGSRRCEPLTSDYGVLWKASDPMREIGYCPALARLSGGRLIGCMLHAGPMAEKQREWTVKVHTSDDRGRRWTHRTDVAMIDCFPFAAGSRVYVIGGRYDLTIIKSDDQGDTWSAPSSSPRASSGTHTRGVPLTPTGESTS